jgi:class 3 adenylate cyclase
MFCDLVGSTALSAKLDPEDMRDVVRAYQNAVAGEVTRFAGHVAKFMGDGVLAYFGYPLAHEDDAERAVRASLSIKDAVSQAHRTTTLLAAAAALSLYAAALAPAAARIPMAVLVAGIVTLAFTRSRAAASLPPRMQLLSRVAITPRTQAALLSVDGAGWLVVIGEGCAQLARAELVSPGEKP